MGVLDKISLGITGEKVFTVTHDMTVQHILSTMPAVYSTPTMVLHMETVGTASIAHLLPEGHVSVGMGINMRHLAATRVGAIVRITSEVVEVSAKSVLFEVEAWEGERKIGDGTHRRGVVDIAKFESRFGVT